MQIKSRSLSLQNKVLFGSFVVLVALTIALRPQSKPSENNPPEAVVTAQADTFIPKGSVLVPVELQNIQAVAGLIGSHGLIDLYGALPDGNGFQIAEAVKILQAPLNPEQFAVLVSAPLAKKIMQYRGVYWGVVRNRSLADSPQKSLAQRTQIHNTPEPVQTARRTTHKTKSRKARTLKATHSGAVPVEIEYQNDLEGI